MDFIERWFGVAPDSGSGSLEVTLILMALVVLAAPTNWQDQVYEAPLPAQPEC